MACNESTKLSLALFPLVNEGECTVCKAWLEECRLHSEDIVPMGSLGCVRE